MSESNPAGATVPDLIRQREQLTGWIARLDEVGPQASSRAAERVRADYAARLQRVNEELSAHRGEIEADLAAFRAALAEAEQMAARAADEMDEVSLRHLIGELDEAAWNQARPGLERAVSDAGDAVARARGEVEHLQQLAADIAGASAALAPPLPALQEPVAPAAASEEDEWSAGQAWPADPPPLPAVDEPAPALGQPRFAETESATKPESFMGPESFTQPETSVFADAEEEFEPSLPLDQPPAQARTDASLQVPPTEPRQAAEAASVDEWDPFGGEFAAETKPGDAEEDLPWLEGIDEASRGAWTPPAADEGLDFLREIEESTRGGSAGPPPAAADLGADDLAFLEELDRAIGNSPASGGGSRTPTPPPAQPAGGTPPAAASAGNRAEPLLCKECGAINEPHSWYCEICGSEL